MPIELYTAPVGKYLVVDEAPLLEKRVHTHDRANIASKVTSTGCDGKIFHRVEPVGINHEVTIIFIDSWSLASVAVVEELGQRLALNVVNRVHVEPGAITWQHDGVRL